MTARMFLSGSLRPASGSGKILKRKNTGLRSESELKATIQKPELDEQQTTPEVEVYAEVEVYKKLISELM